MEQSALLLIELVALFFGVSFVLRLFQRRVGDARLGAWMGGPPATAALKGITVGFATPFCTYSAIPLLVGFRQAGVSAAGYVAFIAAAPVVDPILFGALTLIVGIGAAVTYLFVAFTAAFALGLYAERVGIDRWLKPLAAIVPPSDHSNVLGCAPATDQSAGCVVEGVWLGWRLEAPGAARSATALLRTMAPLLLAGVAVGFAITTLVPASTAARVTGVSDSLSIPIAAALGIPMYVNTGLFVPIADSLTAAGVGTGAIIALTIAGAGANVPEFIILGRLASLRLIGVFFGYVFAVAIAGGLLVELLFT